MDKKKKEQKRKMPLHFIMYITFTSPQKIIKILCLDYEAKRKRSSF